MIIEATAVIDFNGADEASVDYLTFIQLADAYNVDDAGEVKTSFTIGDTIYFEYNFSSNLRLLNTVSTYGSVNNIGTNSGSMTVQQLFASRDSNDPSTYTLPVTGKSISASYYGRSGNYDIEKLKYGMYQIVADVNRTPFIADLNINYSYGLTKLQTTYQELEEDETFPVSVVYYLELI